LKHIFLLNAVIILFLHRCIFFVHNTILKHL